MSNAAIATLVTASLGIVAVVATFFSPTWTERKIQRRRELRAFRQAKRLIANELRAIEVGCRGMLDYPGAFGDPDEVVTDVSFPMAEWEAHKTVLSESAPDQVWKQTYLVYMRLRALRILHRTTTAQQALEPDVSRFLTTVGDEVVTAANALDVAEALTD